MDKAIVKTFFDRNAAHFLTVADWRGLAQRQGFGSWLSVAKAYAKTHGGSMVLKADGSLLVFTKRECYVSQSTYRPGSWAWEAKTEYCADCRKYHTLPTWSPGQPCTHKA